MTFRFDDFELDADRGVLTRSGVTIPIERKAFELLVHLLRNAERVVDHEELRRAVWPGAHVTAASLHQAVRSVRRALGDEVRAPRFVRTVRGRGVQFAGALAPHSRAPASASYAGRRELLARLAALVDAAARGSGAVVLLTGAPGIGKTRTAAELLAIAAARGMSTASAACFALSARAWGPWQDVIEQVAPDAAQPTAVAGWGELSIALRDALFAGARRRPLVLLIDDLHEADESSVVFLDYLAGHVRRVPILIAAAARSGAEFASAAAARAFARLATRPGVTNAPLAALAPEEIADLVEREAGIRPSAARGADLTERVKGNPLWIHQLLRAGLADALVAESDAAWERLVARGVRAAIHERLAQLPEDARLVLEAIAVLGNEARVSLLMRVCALEPSRIRSALAAARAAGFVRGGEDAGSRLGFDHPLFREAVLELAESARVAALHAAAARALASLPPPERERSHAEIALHSLSAGTSGDPRRAVALGLEAGVRALREHAGDTAERLLDLSVGLLDAAEATPALRCDVWTALAEARHRTGVADSSGAAETALALAREIGSPDRFARAAFALVGTVDRLRLPDPRFVAVLEEALALAGSADAGLRARLLGRLEAECSYLPARERPEALRREALAEAQRSGDPSIELYLIDLPFGGFWQNLPPAARLPLVDRLIQYAARAGRSDLALSALLLRVGELACLGRLAEQGAELERAAREAEELGDGSAQYRVLLHRAMRTLALGDPDQSDEFALRAQALADRGGFPGETLARVQRLMVEIAKGRARDLIEPLTLARRVDPGPGVAALLVHALAAAGEHERCAGVLRELAGEPLDSLSRYPSFVANATVLARAAAFADVPEVAPALERILLAERDRIAVRGMMTYHGPVALALAACAQLRGARAEARRLCAEAESLALRTGSPVWLAEARAELSACEADPPARISPRRPQAR